MIYFLVVISYERGIEVEIDICRPQYFIRNTGLYLSKIHEYIVESFHMILIREIKKLIFHNKTYLEPL
jgi:hypothetical protein